MGDGRILNHRPRLAESSRAALEYMTAKKLLGHTALITFAEQVRSAVDAMRKQVSHLDPTLRYVRERTDRFQAAEFARELVEFHGPSLAAAGIGFTLVDPVVDFALHIGRGKLVQVADNLVSNSRYWLREELRARRIEKGEIRIRVERPAILVEDSGRGVDTSLESTLFEPFVTNRPPGQGHGLGLFIARQLLEGSGCSLFLRDERNTFGRRYMFEINLAGAEDNG